MKYKSDKSLGLDQANIELPPFKDHGQHPQQIDQNRIPLQNDNINIRFIIVFSTYQTIYTVCPNTCNIDGQQIFDYQAPLAHHTTVPASKLIHIHGHISNGCEPHNKKYNRINPMQFASSFPIDGTDGNPITQYRGLSNIEQCFMQFLKSNTISLKLQPPKHNKKRKRKYRRTKQHNIPKHNILRIMFSSAGHCSMWEWWFLFV